MSEAVKKRSKLKMISFRPDVAEKIEEAAKKENRSVSNYVASVLMKHMESK